MAKIHAMFYGPLTTLPQPIFSYCLPIKVEYASGLGNPPITPDKDLIHKQLFPRENKLKDLILSIPKDETIVFILTKESPWDSSKQVKHFEKFCAENPWVKYKCHTPKGVTNKIHREKSHNLFLYTVQGAKE